MRAFFLVTAPTFTSPRRDVTQWRRERERRWNLTTDNRTCMLLAIRFNFTCTRIFLTSNFNNENHCVCVNMNLQLTSSSLLLAGMTGSHIGESFLSDALVWVNRRYPAVVRKHPKMKAHEKSVFFFLPAHRKLALFCFAPFATLVNVI